MTELHLFYLTGKIIWWLLMGSLVAAAALSAIVAPVMAYHKVSKVLWQWRVMAELAHTGFTQEDIVFIASVPGGLPGGCKVVELLRWVETIKMRGKAVSASKAKGDL